MDRRGCRLMCWWTYTAVKSEGCRWFFNDFHCGSLLLFYQIVSIFKVHLPSNMFFERCCPVRDKDVDVYDRLGHYEFVWTRTAIWIFLLHLKQTSRLRCRLNTERGRTCVSRVSLLFLSLGDVCVCLHLTMFSFATCLCCLVVFNV